VNLSIEIGALESFADIFFDGLIFDWVVQSQINASLDEARRSGALVTRAVDSLRRLRTHVDVQRAAIDHQRSDLIERS
jgi:hypothetical protein